MYTESWIKFQYLCFSPPQKKNPRINTGFNELKKLIFAFLGKKSNNS